ncbi:MAG: hypothetical protein HN590_07675 [Calditrichaeota bacterium]|jgi:hypothetical protein|nr:hypothetical protein [Calditrichota bacterium]MBT7790373.1 hypothetical protein [Calditrichota bacterium]
MKVYDPMKGVREASRRAEELRRKKQQEDLRRFQEKQRRDRDMAYGSMFIAPKIKGPR